MLFPVLPSTFPKSQPATLIYSRRAWVRRIRAADRCTFGAFQCRRLIVDLLSLSRPRASGSSIYRRYIYYRAIYTRIMPRPLVAMSRSGFVAGQGRRYWPNPQACIYTLVNTAWIGVNSAKPGRYSGYYAPL